jgi:hypothetical protein
VIDAKREIERIVARAAEDIDDQVEIFLDEGVWRETVVNLTDAMGATMGEHVEIMALVDTLISTALAKSLMERVAQNTEEKL